MSVIVTLRMKGDASTLEQVAKGNPERIETIIGHAKELGLIAHRFYGSDDGQLMVVDEWPDAESFQRFFSEMGPEIGPFMAEAGIPEQPEVVFWRKLDTRDDYGWD
jgi:heme-degrading monooxygenase HmoA